MIKKSELSKSFPEIPCSYKPKGNTEVSWNGWMVPQICTKPVPAEEPLNAWKNKGVKFNLRPTCQAAFDVLQIS